MSRLAFWLLSRLYWRLTLWHSTIWAPLGPLLLLDLSCCSPFASIFLGLTCCSPFLHGGGILFSPTAEGQDESSSSTADSEEYSDEEYPLEFEKLCVGPTLEDLRNKYGVCVYSSVDI